MFRQIGLVIELVWCVWLKLFRKKDCVNKNILDRIWQFLIKDKFHIANILNCYIPERFLVSLFHFHIDPFSQFWSSSEYFQHPLWDVIAGRCEVEVISFISARKIPSQLQNSDEGVVKEFTDNSRFTGDSLSSLKRITAKWRCRSQSWATEGCLWWTWWLFR